MARPPAVVLAAGEGVRLRPLTHNRPKPLLPAGTSPVLEHVLDTLTAVGVEEIVLVVGYGRARVQDAVGSTHEGASISYLVQDPQLGSGHALLQAEDALDEPFLVVNGDQIVAPRIVRDVLDAHRETADAVASLAVLDHDRVDRYGGVTVEDGRVACLRENPETPGAYRLNAGVYAFERDVFDAIRSVDPEDGEVALTSGLQTAVDDGATVRAVETRGLWVDANYPWDVLAVARELFEHGVLADGTAPDAGVADAARVHESAVLRPPVAVAPDAVVGPGAVLGPNVCVGQNATVEASAVLENTVLDADARVGANGTLRDCVVGQGVRVGSGTTVPGGPGDVVVEDRVIPDRQLGAVIADRARLGGGVTVSPGTLIGPDAEIGAGATLDANVPPGAEVRR